MGRPSWIDVTGVPDHFVQRFIDILVARPTRFVFLYEPGWQGYHEHEQRVVKEQPIAGWVPSLRGSMCGSAAECGDPAPRPRKEDEGSLGWQRKGSVEAEVKLKARVLKQVENASNPDEVPDDIGIKEAQQERDVRSPCRAAFVGEAPKPATHPSPAATEAAKEKRAIMEQACGLSALHPSAAGVAYKGKLAFQDYECEQCLSDFSDEVLFAFRRPGDREPSSWCEACVRVDVALGMNKIHAGRTKEGNPILAAVSAIVRGAPDAEINGLCDQILSPMADERSEKLKNEEDPELLDQAKVAASLQPALEEPEEAGDGKLPDPPMVAAEVPPPAGYDEEEQEKQLIRLILTTQRTGPCAHVLRVAPKRSGDMDRCSCCSSPGVRFCCQQFMHCGFRACKACLLGDLKAQKQRSS